MSGSQESCDFLISLAPMKRISEPIEIARAIVYLLADAAYSTRHRPDRRRRPVRTMSTPHDTPDNPKALSGRTALITGAPRSIGRAITEVLARDGANIVAHYRSRQEEAAELAQLLESRGSQVLTVPGDLTDPETVRQLFDAAIARFGGIDVVVANAGRSGATKPVADITDEEYDGLQAVNNRAVFLVLREAARRIRDGGRIINISSSPPRTRRRDTPCTPPARSARA